MSGSVDAAPTVPVAVGGQPSGAGSRFFDGLIDDVRIVRRALSAEELLAIVAATAPAESKPQRDIVVEAGPAGPPTMLHQNHPNPFNPTTVIRYDLAASGIADLRIYDARGALVKVLESAYRPAGRYEIVWDGTNGRGERAASGVYFYRLRTPSFNRTRKMVLLK